MNKNINDKQELIELEEKIKIAEESGAPIEEFVLREIEILQQTIDALEDNVSKIRYEVGKRIRLRLTPELRFIPDDSLERGTKVMDLIDKISKGEL